MPSPKPKNQDSSHKAIRLVRRGGEVSVVRHGFPTRLLRDYFYSLLQRGWPRLMLTLVGFILTSNAFFATLYEVLGLHIANANTWWDYFFFSVQTMATVGYGLMSPVGIAANLVAAIESIYGLMVFGVIAGLVFSKFSRPTAKLIFSEVAVITNRNGQKSFMFRMVNERQSQIIDGRLNVSLLKTERTAEGDVIRRFVDMRLVREHTPIFALTFTAQHVIDESSPLFGATAESLKNGEIEIVIVFSGVDEIFSQTIYTRHSYILDEIRWGHRFQDILGKLPDGRRVIEYAKFHKTEQCAHRQVEAESH